MYIYAQLDENNVCTGISRLSGEAQDHRLVPIESFDRDLFWRKYENGQWSEGKYEPQSTAPLTEFEQLKQQQTLMQAALDELILGGAL